MSTVDFDGVSAFRSERQRSSSLHVPSDRGFLAQEVNHQDTKLRMNDDIVMHKELL